MRERTFCTCSACRGAAIEMRIVALDADRGIGLCETAGGRRRTVDVTSIERAVTGEVILVHANVAIARTREAGCRSELGTGSAEANNAHNIAGFGS